MGADQYRVFWMPGGTSVDGGGINRQGVDKPTYLLLHGIGLSHRSFTPIAKLLRLTGHVIAVDLPGFGDNRRPEHPLTVEQAARGIADILDRVAASPVIAVGHSMGAQFALELALIRPDLVAGVVMIGPVVDPRHRTLLQQGVRLLRDALLEPPRTNLMVAFDYARSGVRWFATESVAMLAYPTHERIAALKQPMLVIRGGHDPIAGADWSAWLAGRVDQGCVVSTHRFRHNVVHSSPTDVAGPLARFAALTHVSRTRKGWGRAPLQ